MSFFGITDLTTFVLGTLFIVLLPGPNSLFVLTVAVKRGRRAGFIGACGIFVGDAILMVLTVLGAASVLQTHQLLYNIIRFSGAIYLSWIGLQLIVGAINKWQLSSKLASKQTHVAQQLDRQLDTTIQSQQELNKGMPHPFYRALMISLLNPKAIFFFLSFFVQFVDPHYPNVAVPFLIQAVIVQTFSALYLTLLIFFGYQLAHSFNRHYQITVSLNALAGFLFCGYGARLALASSLSH